MALRTEAYYRSIAHEALARLDFSEPPVPFEVLLQSLGIPVRLVNLPTFFMSATVYEEGLPIMLVNWAQPEHERRRAIAHMVGHVLLVLRGEGNTYPRDTASHEEADMVAKELMLPSSVVVEQARLWFNDHRYLARLFGVTEEDMMNRMRELGIIKGQGIGWDF